MKKARKESNSGQSSPGSTVAAHEAMRPREPSAALQKVFVLLRARSGNDFSCCKNNTISRRIERRMSVHQFDSLPRYVRFLQENPQEVELLCKELLIGVTNFFRDPGLFDFLKEKAIPRLLQDRAKEHHRSLILLAMEEITATPETGRPTKVKR